MKHNLDFLDLPLDTSSFINRITMSLISKAQNTLKAHIRLKLIEKLKYLGYVFEDDYEFNQFCINRVSTIHFEDRVNYSELYLDFVNDENKGTLIFCYSDKVSCDYSDDKIIVTIG